MVNLSRKYAIVISVGAGALCLILCLALHKSAYKRSKAPPDSADVQQALQMLRSMAAAPATAPGYMSSDARQTARKAVAGAAEAMGKAKSVERKDSQWFGSYLRVGVTCPRAGGVPYEQHFFLKKQDGELRITGLDL
jgi:hypothetical protein